MADLATVFHWSPTHMDVMSLSELMGWWEEAKLRAEPEKGE